MQMVCDHYLKVRHVIVGYSASVHDAHIFGSCQLAMNPAQFFSDSQWLAADSAYRLMEDVIMPFWKNSTFVMLMDRNNFNKYFSGYRVQIENCFGILKEKLSSLKELRVWIRDFKTHKYACDWIITCSVLYNMILSYFEDEVCVRNHWIWVKWWSPGS